MRRTLLSAIPIALCLVAPSVTSGHAADVNNATFQKAIAPPIQRLINRYDIPGMAVGIVLDGQTYVYNSGVASKTAEKPVTNDTLFEIGSVSKTFTATLASYAQVTGQLSLSDQASKDLPGLRGSSFDHVSLLQLGTHTAGGLPLQVPDSITTTEQLMAYFRAWKPVYPPGTYRVYANPSIGMLGMIAAQSLHEDFTMLLEGKLFPVLGMSHTYLKVPSEQMEDYAQGYTETDAPIRMAPGVLASEAYGIRTTANDLLRFIEANLKNLVIDEKWQRAITNTHTGYYQVGAMTQDLIWEQYRYPVAQKDLVEGNSAKIAFQANPVIELNPPRPPQEDVLINKTGSTNGFSTYVAFVPARKIGVVLLANKHYPIEARVTTATEIMAALLETEPEH